MKRFVVLAVLMLSGSAFAQTQSAEKPIVRKTIIDMDTEEIIGDINGPKDALVKSRHKVKFESLVRVRTNFQQELMQSVTQL